MDSAPGHISGGSMATPSSSSTHHVTALLQTWGRDGRSALEDGEVLEVSPATLTRQCRTARVWLGRELTPLPG